LSLFSSVTAPPFPILSVHLIHQHLHLILSSSSLYNPRTGLNWTASPLVPF
jgi:hypothetical protein